MSINNKTNIHNIQLFQSKLFQLQQNHKPILHLDYWSLSLFRILFNIQNYEGPIPMKDPEQDPYAIWEPEQHPYPIQYPTRSLRILVRISTMGQYSS